uniref:Uncharacterized protein n=1 Tax=Echinococcus granulosus TaxID=6210 RepID=A0A068WD02_ECHGR|nr:hypothetical protein EgrG_001038200 [Echinococcus granulosus]
MVRTALSPASDATVDKEWPDLRGWFHRLHFHHWVFLLSGHDICSEVCSPPVFSPSYLCLSLTCELIPKFAYGNFCSTLIIARHKLYFTLSYSLRKN